jgi:phenylalanyl-tRNA synthetase beta chain
MLISYNWLKKYVSELPEAEKLMDVFTYHICEAEEVENSFVQGSTLTPTKDTIFNLGILPNRAHDLLSHRGIAWELACLLDLSFVQPSSFAKNNTNSLPELVIKIQSKNCRRYMGCIARNIKVGPSPSWLQDALATMGQRSINNMVDLANFVMFDCGQPIHCFDLDKMNGGIIVREAKEGEKMVTLDGKEVNLNSNNLVIADSQDVLAIAGIKGGKKAEVDENTKNIIIEVANFDPGSVRKTSQAINILTDASKRFANDFSPELGHLAIQEIISLIAEISPETTFEKVVDNYPQKQMEKKILFSVDRISKIIGLNIYEKEMEKILKQYHFKFSKITASKSFEIIIPYWRLDLENEEDVAEEVIRILGYDKIVDKIPKINFIPKQNETYLKIQNARKKLLNEGYFEVFKHVFCQHGKVEVLESASDKNFLRTNLTDGLKESFKLNQTNAPILGLKSASEVKIFEIGTVFPAADLKEEIHVAYRDKKGNKDIITEVSLEEFIKQEVKPSIVSSHTTEALTSCCEKSFQMWSEFPFIIRDVAVWVPASLKASEVLRIINDYTQQFAGEILLRDPELFDEFKKGEQVSYAFRLIFQAYDKTLTDTEVNQIMLQIVNKIKTQPNWQVR